MDDAEEEFELAVAKVRKLRKQRCIWADKMAYTVRRGLDSIEKLERFEAEEAEAERRAAEESRRSVESLIPEGLLPERFEALDLAFFDSNLLENFDFSQFPLETALSKS